MMTKKMNQMKKPISSAHFMNDSMIRILILFILFLPVLSEASTLPRQFGKFTLGMTVSEAARITGEE
jgi:hypothetical protein